MKRSAHSFYTSVVCLSVTGITPTRGFRYPESHSRYRMIKVVRGRAQTLKAFRISLFARRPAQHEAR